jgi:aminopeptidase N
VNGEHKRVQVRDNLKHQEFDIPLDFEPQWVDFDPDDFIDKTIQFDEPAEALAAQAERDPSMMSRLWATQQLGKNGTASNDGCVDALAKVLGGDAFYAVRAAAATGLGSIATEKAKTALLSAVNQPDSRVRSGVFAALSHFARDPAIARVLVSALRNDSSYAVEAAAARSLGKLGDAQAFDVLQAEVLSNPETDVMLAALAGLASTRDSRAVGILLEYAQPGQPERIRVRALSVLEEMKDVVGQDQFTELIRVVGAAIRDPFYLTQEAGEELVGVFHLVQFEADISKEAEEAPLAMQRDTAKQILKLLRSQPKGAK